MNLATTTKFFAAVFVAMTLTTAAQAGPAKTIAQTTVTKDFVESGMSWNGRPNPGFVLRWKTRVIDGEIAICGAVAYGDIQMRSESRTVLSRAFVEYKDRKVMKNMTFFKNAKSMRKLMGSKANCATTGIKAPRGNYEVLLGWPGGSFKG